MGGNAGEQRERGRLTSAYGFLSFCIVDRFFRFFPPLCDARESGVGDALLLVGVVLLMVSAYQLIVRWGELAQGKPTASRSCGGALLWDSTSMLNRHVWILSSIPQSFAGSCCRYHPLVHFAFSFSSFFFASNPCSFQSSCCFATSYA